MDPSKPFFDAWATAYDAFYAEQDGDDIEFYVDIATEADGPVLEVGCGTGRIYLPMLDVGVDAYGIDLSAEMLAVLRDRATERGLTPHVRQADMTAFEPERTYELIIVPFRTFLHNLSCADQQAALRHFRKALAPDGRLVLNFFVPNFELICTQYGDPRTKTIEYDGDVCRVTILTELEDQVDQIVRERRTLERDGDQLIEATFRLTLISKREFELLLETTGWDDWTVYGGFDHEPLQNASQEMVWIVEK